MKIERTFEHIDGNTTLTVDISATADGHYVMVEYLVNSMKVQSGTFEVVMRLLSLSKDQAL